MHLPRLPKVAFFNTQSAVATRSAQSNPHEEDFIPLEIPQAHDPESIDPLSDWLSAIRCSAIAQQHRSALQLWKTHQTLEVLPLISNRARFST